MPYKDKEERNKRARERYASDPAYKERVLATVARSLETNPRILTPEQMEYRRAAARDRNRKNPQSNRDRVKLWRLNNPEAYKHRRRINEATRRARKFNQFIEAVNHAVVYQMHGGMCGICKQFIEGDFHVDHIIPLSRGGMHGYVNVQPAHPSCNLSKGGRT